MKMMLRVMALALLPVSAFAAISTFDCVGMVKRVAVATRPRATAAEDPVTFNMAKSYLHDINGVDSAVRLYDAESQAISESIRQVESEIEKVAESLRNPPINAAAWDWWAADVKSVVSGNITDMHLNQLRRNTSNAEVSLPLDVQVVSTPNGHAFDVGFKDHDSKFVIPISEALPINANPGSLQTALFKHLRDDFLPLQSLRLRNLQSLKTQFDALQSAHDTAHDGKSLLYSELYGQMYHRWVESQGKSTP